MGYLLPSSSYLSRFEPDIVYTEVHLSHVLSCDMNSHARCSGLIENLAFLRRRVVGRTEHPSDQQKHHRLNEALGDNVGQIDDARCSPLVIVPGDNLDHVVAHHHGERSIDGSGNIGTAEIDDTNGVSVMASTPSWDHRRPL